MVQHFIIVILSTALLLVAGSTSAEAGPSKASVSGTYTASVGGKTVTLVLDKNGSGSLAGETGRWSLSGRAIKLMDNEGNAIRGTVSGDTLSFTIEGTTIRFSRQSRASGGAAPSTRGLAPFKPKLVAGKTARDAETGSVRVPSGWKHGWGKGVDGKDAYNLTSKKETVVVSIGRTMLMGEDASASPATLLESALAELLGGASAERAVDTESFTVGGKPAGRVVVRAPVNGTDLEGYLGVILVDGWAISVVALYKVADAKEGRAAADTVLATLRARVPKRNVAAMKKMVGCWEYYKGRDGGQTQIKLRLGGDGTYSRMYFTSISVAGASALDEDKSAGTWSVTGSVLTLVPEGKATKQYDVSFNKGAMTLGSTRYIPCS